MPAPSRTPAVRSNTDTGRKKKAYCDNRKELQRVDIRRRYGWQLRLENAASYRKPSLRRWLRDGTTKRHVDGMIVVEITIPLLRIFCACMSWLPDRRRYFNGDSRWDPRIVLSWPRTLSATRRARRESCFSGISSIPAKRAPASRP